MPVENIDGRRCELQLEIVCVPVLVPRALGTQISGACTLCWPCHPAEMGDATERTEMDDQLSAAVLFGVIGPAYTRR